MSAAVSPVPAAPSGSPLSYLNAERGLLSWLTTVDHKRIGLMYLVSTLFFFLLAGLMAIALRVELWTPQGDVFDPDTYNKLFTLHGGLMVFAFIIPSIPFSPLR